MSNPIEAPQAAVPALSEDDKAAAAEAEAKAAAEAKKNAHKDRYILYTVPGRAAQNRVDPDTGKKLATKPSEAHDFASVGDGSYASRVGVALAVAKIRPQDFKAVGIDASDTLVWDFANQWRIPVSRLSAEQVDWLLSPQENPGGAPRFALVDGNGVEVDR